jgi:hypothetical protein
MKPFSLCLHQPYPPHARILHPRYFVQNPTAEQKICPTHPYVSASGKIHIFASKTSETAKQATADQDGPFNIPVFLAAVYRIHSLEDAVQWVRSNAANNDTDTVDRVLDLVWDAFVPKAFAKDPERMDELVDMYQYYIDKLYIDTKKNIRSVVTAVVHKYAGKNLTYSSKKSYQKIIKKNL